MIPGPVVRDPCEFIASTTTRLLSGDSTHHPEIFMTFPRRKRDRPPRWDGGHCKMGPRVHSRSVVVVVARQRACRHRTLADNDPDLILSTAASRSQARPANARSWDMGRSTIKKWQAKRICQDFLIFRVTKSFPRRYNAAL